MVNSLYIHIPFCKSICTYCDFAKLVGNPEMMEQYLLSLEAELDFYRSTLTSVQTIHLGGGTPSALPLDLLERLLEKIASLIDVKTVREFAIEANPNDVSPAFVALLKKYSIKRVSLGVESSHPKHLRAMNRSHTLEQTADAVGLLQSQGIHNINLDFIYAWPKQTMDDLRKDVDYALALKPTHLSFYALILEPKTILFHDYQKHQIELIDEDTDADMYEYLLDRLPEAGYHHYEISNFAIKGFESKHNLAYWNLEEYLGIGMGAHSQVGQTRFHNHASMQKYLQSVNDKKSGVESEDPCDLVMETGLMGLRKTQGIHLNSVQERFGVDFLKQYPKLQDNIRDGLLEIVDNHLRLTRKGMLLMNYVERSFI